MTGFVSLGLFTSNAVQSESVLMFVNMLEQLVSTSLSSASSSCDPYQNVPVSYTHLTLPTTPYV